MPCGAPLAHQTRTRINPNINPYNSRYNENWGGEGTLSNASIPKHKDGIFRNLTDTCTLLDPTEDDV